MVEAALATFTQHTHTIDFGVVACLFACLLISFRYARLSQLGKCGSRCMLTSLLSLHYSRYICSMFQLQRVCRVSLLFFSFCSLCHSLYGWISRRFNQGNKLFSDNVLFALQHFRDCHVERLA